MKKLKHTLAYLLFIGGVLALLPSAAAQAQPTLDAGDGGNGCNASFLTFPAWYNGVVKAGDDGCQVMSPTEVGGFSPFIWRIVLNIIEIMLNAVGYAAVGFIIYGGYKYIYSAGSPNGMMAARKTIMNAVIGLVLSIMSIAIVNTIAGSL